MYVNYSQTHCDTSLSTIFPKSCNISLTVWSINCFCSIYINWRPWILLYISTKLKLAKINPVIQTVLSSIKWIITGTEGQIKFLLRSLFGYLIPPKSPVLWCLDDRYTFPRLRTSFGVTPLSKNPTLLQLLLYLFTKCKPFVLLT